MTQPAVGPRCLECRHIQSDYTCDAFPRGIADVIAFGGHDHTTHVPGDRGIKFEPRQPGEPEPEFEDLGPAEL